MQGSQQSIFALAKKAMGKAVGKTQSGRFSLGLFTVFNLRAFSRGVGLAFPLIVLKFC